MPLERTLKSTAITSIQMLLIIAISSYLLESKIDLIFYKALIALVLAFLLQGTDGFQPNTSNEHFGFWMKKHIKRIIILSCFASVLTYTTENSVYEIIITIILVGVFFTLFKWYSPRYFRKLK